MGHALWDETREKVYSENNYCCWACGVHMTQAWKYVWLEAHETYEYDVGTMRAKLKEIVGLCHRCHMFNHIEMCRSNGASEQDIQYIVTSGFALLPDALRAEANVEVRYELHRVSPNIYDAIYGAREDFSRRLPQYGWVLVWKDMEWRRSVGRLVCRPVGDNGIFKTAVRQEDGSLALGGTNDQESWV